VVAAGNERKDACTVSPASSPKAVTVGAIDWTGNKMADFSNYGRCVDILAPGDYINTTTSPCRKRGAVECFGRGYGTSIAAPHVVGVAALIYSKIKRIHGRAPSNNVVIMNMKNWATKDAIINLPPATPNLLLFTYY
jgi:hypothetical protein